jgi:hypothetical protein
MYNISRSKAGGGFERLVKVFQGHFESRPIISSGV